MVDETVVRGALAEIRARIDEAAATAGRRPDAVAVLAAVKYVERADLAALRAAGVGLVGENRTDALVAKQAGYEDAFVWDFIGHLQSRKAREVVGRVRLIHALESVSTARQLDERAAEPQDVLVEVNVADDPSKYGVRPADVDPFLEALAGLPRIRVRGLMTMPALASDPELSRAPFAALRAMAARCEERWAGTHAFEELSMGTSQDYLVGVAEGATIVRLGSVLYGRP